MARAKSKRGGKTNRAGRELLDAVREAHHAVTTGEFSTISIHDVEIPDPGEWGPERVKALRERMQVSHRVFGELVGVSRVQVAHWEYGIRKPARLACRLLDMIDADPDRYMQTLMVRKAG